MSTEKRPLTKETGPHFGPLLLLNSNVAFLQIKHDRLFIKVSESQTEEEKIFGDKERKQYQKEENDDKHD